MVEAMSDGRFLVVDGNSTVLNAIASGWTDVPCVQVKSSIP